jgi:hypothetical protein
MFQVIELQKLSETRLAALTNEKKERNEALSLYFQLLSVAALSAVPKHSVVILNEDGSEWMHYCFDHSGGEETV